MELIKPEFSGFGPIVEALIRIAGDGTLSLPWAVGVDRLATACRSEQLRLVGMLHRGWFPLMVQVDTDARGCGHIPRVEPGIVSPIEAFVTRQNGIPEPFVDWLSGVDHVLGEQVGASVHGALNLHDALYKDSAAKGRFVPPKALTLAAWSISQIQAAGN